MYFTIVIGYRVRVWPRSRNVRSHLRFPKNRRIRMCECGLVFVTTIHGRDGPGMTIDWISYSTGGGALWGTISFEIGESIFFLSRYILNIRDPISYRERMETFDASWASLTTRSWQVSKQIKMQMNELYGNVMAHTHIYAYVCTYSYLYLMVTNK